MDPTAEQGRVLDVLGPTPKILAQVHLLVPGLMYGQVQDALAWLQKHGYAKYKKGPHKGWVRT